MWRCEYVKIFDRPPLFEQPFAQTLSGKICWQICWQITVAALMQPLQYYLQDPAAKDNRITHAAVQPWRSHYNVICRHWIAKHNRTTRNGVGNCSSKTGWISTPKRKKTILKHFLKELLKGKLLAPKFRKSADKSLLQPGYTIYEIQLQKTTVLRMQPRHQATLTQPLQCDLQRLNCKTQ